ncbi:hypothetical protein QN277_027375 [Acacia crassicarpa]|uniref:RNase H type-1 domain-containing protein n=1 Tax=Acacia crassicarpa TaxID=499986 RepID=A0AAE1MMX5_9FABA|nr:hypothetical protein QN277_027375 [Acacia crassicarpa]
MKAKSIVSSGTKARGLLQGVNLNGRQILSRVELWEVPCHGWIKLNVDGACAHNRVATCGGIIRDDTGSLKQGFMFRAEEPADSLLAELWAVLFGLKMCWDLGERRVSLESDAEEVVALLTTDSQPSHPDEDVIQEIKGKIGRSWEVQVRWIPRDANKAADYVAKQAFDVWPDIHHFHSTFGDLGAILAQDKGNVGLSSGVG